MGYIWGLDIGISSVGWAVVDTDYNIIESGSNIFQAAEASENIDRRRFRQGRRIKRRQRNRIEDFKKLWVKSGIAIPEDINNNQLELRNRGLESELSLDEIYAVLYTMLKHRGISYLEDAVDETTSGNL